MIRLILTLALIFSSQMVKPHEQSIATIFLIEMSVQKYDDFDNARDYQLIWQVDLKDIARVIELDNDGDGLILGKEILNNQTQLEGLVDASFIAHSNDARCRYALAEITYNQLSNGMALIIRGNIGCIGPVTTIDYRFLRELDSLHVAQITIDRNEKKITTLLTFDESVVPLDGNVLHKSVAQKIFDFAIQGLWHIWIGLDHLAFLVVLFFSAIMLADKPDQANKRSNEKLAFLHRAFLMKLLSFVTAFTLAHTLTLIAASLNWITLSSRLVESIIAASVAWGALLLITGKTTINTPTVFNFGLIHGLGFASVLADLSGNLSANIWLVIGFNLGVEIGQILFLGGVVIMVRVLTIVVPLKKLSTLVAIPLLIVSLIWFFERLYGGSENLIALSYMSDCF